MIMIYNAHFVRGFMQARGWYDGVTATTCLAST